MRDAVFGNVGTIVSFRIGAEDAEALEKEFFPEFIAEDFVNLGKYTIYTKLMIDGIASHPFSAVTLPPPVFQGESHREKIIQVSRDRYGTPQKVVEEKIVKWSGVEELVQRPSVNPQFSEQILYDARCSNCGKDTKVVFPPDGKRPTYCKSCRKKLKLTREKSGKAREPEKFVHLAPVAAASGERAEEPQNVEKHAKSISLREALNQEPRFFYPQKGNARGSDAPKRKEANRSELKRVLDEALSRKTDAPTLLKKEEKKGFLRPGETVYFEQ